MNFRDRDCTNIYKIYPLKRFNVVFLWNLKRLRQRFGSNVSYQAIMQCSFIVIIRDIFPFCHQVDLRSWTLPIWQWCVRWPAFQKHGRPSISFSIGTRWLCCLGYEDDRIHWTSVKHFSKGDFTNFPEIFQV